ncbi:MAG: hypothetical protein QOF89_3792 [Acidobacteriota bacterium]|jgi:hypothetical protein|nr:hypothetical protein [Acidobacteriota bacterium]
MMNHSIVQLIQVAGFFISVFGAWWVGQDANRLKRNGAKVTPGVWAVLVFLLWLVSLPIYLLLRQTLWRSQLSPPRKVAEEFE